MRCAASGRWLLLAWIGACGGKGDVSRSQANVAAPVVGTPEVSTPASPVADDPAPTRAVVELVGEPLHGYPRLQAGDGRTLWDLHAVGDRIYLGHGDATANTGPTDVIALHVATGDFRVEATLQEEAIMSYRRFGDRLFLPGVDPVGSPDDGAVHVRRDPGRDGEWTTLVVPNAVHVSDVAVHDGRLFAATQRQPNVAAVVESADDGATWRTHVVPGWRANALFELDGALYVGTFGGGVSRRDDGGFRWVASPFGPSATAGPPDLEAGVDRELQETVIDRVVTCAGATWAIVLHGSVGYGYSSSSLYRLGVAAGEVTRERASPDGRVTDLFVWEDRCHAVANVELEQGWLVRVLVAGEGGAWETAVEAQAPAIAQSGTRVGGDFYFGLGCWGGCGPGSGAVARVSAGSLGLDDAGTVGARE